MRVVFISIYPTGEDLRDGMHQRIRAVDVEFDAVKRVYLSLSFKNGYFEDHVSENMTIIKANIIKNRKEIINILHEASHIYIHSLHNGLLLFPFLSKCDNKNITMDIHGVVPEELKFSGKVLRSYIYSFVEKKLFSKLNNAVAVTKSMVDYYLSKYPKANQINYIVKPIYPKNSIRKNNENKLKSVKIKYNISNSDVIFIYSGNTQKWQNIDLMVKCMESMNNKKYVFFILTQRPDVINNKIQHLLDNGYRIFVESVDPSDLPAYYELAHYGFMLRDDVIVNKVASPTKMIEYLGYGITPIVKSPDIGDWNTEGYDFISYNDDLNNLSIRKSISNRKIAEENINVSEAKNLNKSICGSQY